jgi:hypothetical protein
MASADPLHDGGFGGDDIIIPAQNPLRRSKRESVAPRLPADGASGRLWSGGTG